VTEVKRALLVAFVLLIVVLVVLIAVPAAREWRLERKLSKVKPGISPGELEALFGPPMAEGSNPEIGVTGLVYEAGEGIFVVWTSGPQGTECRVERHTE
jgi:hypothetical protein